MRTIRNMNILKTNESDENGDGEVTVKETMSFLRRLWKVTPTHVRRVIVAVFGGTLMLGGMALVVLPGPFTLPLVLAGLVVLASEFVWAKRLLGKVRSKTGGMLKTMRRIRSR